MGTAPPGTPATTRVRNRSSCCETSGAILAPQPREMRMRRHRIAGSTTRPQGRDSTCLKTYESGKKMKSARRASRAAAFGFCSRSNRPRSCDRSSPSFLEAPCLSSSGGVMASLPIATQTGRSCCDGVSVSLAALYEAHTYLPEQFVSRFWVAFCHFVMFSRCLCSFSLSCDRYSI